jgi:MFS family permease
VPAVALIVAASALLGVVSGIAMAVSNALLQQRTDPVYLGRVSSVTSLCTLGLSPLTYPVVGLVAAAWGTGVFFAGCGVVCLVAAATAVSVRAAE